MSPNAKEKDDARFNSSAGLGRPMAGGGQRSFKTVFKETTEKGPMQVWFVNGKKISVGGQNSFFFAPPTPTHTLTPLFDIVKYRSC